MERPSEIPPGAVFVRLGTDFASSEPSECHGDLSSRGERRVSGGGEADAFSVPE
jgi:hypothetical protein